MGLEIEAASIGNWANCQNNEKAIILYFPKIHIIESIYGPVPVFVTFCSYISLVAGKTKEASGHQQQRHSANLFALLSRRSGRTDERALRRLEVTEGRDARCSGRSRRTRVSLKITRLNRKRRMMIPWRLSRREARVGRRSSRSL